MSAQTPFRFGVISFFPALFPGPLGVSVLGRGLKEGRWSLDCLDIRDYALGGREVDDTPAGGGAGMVLRPDVAAAAIDDARTKGIKGPLLVPSPAGEVFTQAHARELAQGEGALFLCGRFEGIDQRVLEARNAKEISLGPFVLAAGDIAALAMMEAVLRLLPGILGNAESLAEESYDQAGEVEYPHYTRPQIWEKLAIPPVLLSGDHGKIKQFRKNLAATRKRTGTLWSATAKQRSGCRTARFVSSRPEKACGLVTS